MSHSVPPDLRRTENEEDTHTSSIHAPLGAEVGFLGKGHTIIAKVLLEGGCNIQCVFTTKKFKKADIGGGAAIAKSSKIEQGTFIRTSTHNRRIALTMRAKRGGKLLPHESRSLPLWGLWATTTR